MLYIASTPDDEEFLIETPINLHFTFQLPFTSMHLKILDSVSNYTFPSIVFIPKPYIYQIYVGQIKKGFFAGIHFEDVSRKT